MSKEYKVIFEDLFSFAKDERTVTLTDSQYEIALEQKKHKVIVVSKLIGAIHTNLIIHSIQPIP